MPPRPSLASAFRTLSVQHRPQTQWLRPPCIATRVQQRNLTIDPSTSQQPPSQGTSDLLKAKMEAFGHSMESGDSMKPNEKPLTANERALQQLELAVYGVRPWNSRTQGHKFGVPEPPIMKDRNHKTRYHPIVEQMTKLLMRDGKLAKAQRDMAMILNYLRSSPPPKVNPARPLLPGAPPPYKLPLDPVLYLTLAVDSVAPLVRMRGYKGMAGGGKSLEIPIPLAVRQRRRTAFGWILDAVNKKPSKGSGRTMFPHRVAEEIVAVMEGRSSVWDKRQQLHKQATLNRANLSNIQLRNVKIL